jgi:hypothetical protein
MNMVEIDWSRESANNIETRLRSMHGDKLYAAMGNAAARAASSARTVGKKSVRQIYTVKPAAIKSSISIKRIPKGAILRIVGYRLSTKNYKAAKRKKGIFVSVKKGSGDIVPRSFAYGDKFIRRKGDARFPIKGITSPAVPQLFGNAAVREEMAKEAEKKYEERLRHEVSRIMGG